MFWTPYPNHIFNIPMTPQHFITKWQSSQLKERSASQEHFLDICQLLGEPTPAEADPQGTWYCFEKGTTKSEGGKGWADVWKRHHFAWEYKGKQKDLTKAFVQLQRYALALENPPLLVVSDMETIQIYTNFTNTVQDLHTLKLTDLANPQRLQILKWVFTDPEQLRPGRTRTAVTEEIAQEFASLAQRLRERGHPPLQVAHFISQWLFGMFAEAAGLFEGQRVLSESLAASLKRPEHCTATLQNLFTTMQPNSDVLRPWANGMDITRRPSDTWIIDFGIDMSEEEASYYEAPFKYISEHVKPSRDKERRKTHQIYWWRHGDTMRKLRKVLQSLKRFLVTPQIAKYRLFVWMENKIYPDQRLVVIARDDDTTFGILHSRFHEIWALRLGSTLEDRPTYTSTTTFATFPFPEGLTPNLPATDYATHPHAHAIATAAQRLHELRENWLNPPEWVTRVPEVVPGYPDRFLPVNDHAAEQLKKRTLTNLYNANPQWLVNAHRQLDEAVAKAYGWEVDLTEEEVLRRLLELNLKRL